MAGRWRDPSAFRADPAATPAARPSRQQAIALVGVLALVAAGIAVVSYLIRPEKARAFDLFHGSLFLADQNNSPVGIDLTSGKPTIRLTGAGEEVGLSTDQNLGVVPLLDKTLLLNTTTGEFNMVASSGDVVKRTGGGVPLPRRSGDTSAVGVATDDGQAYIVRTGPSGGTDVYLVSQPTVESAINATKGVTPRAGTTMSQAASGAVSANGDLWLLAGAATGTRAVRQLTVPPNSSAGARLRTREHGTVSGPAALGVATSSDGTQVVGVASSDRIEVFTPNAAAPVTVRFRAPTGVDAVLPVNDGAGRLSFVLRGSTGWSLVSVDVDGTGMRGPKQLDGVPAQANLAAPVQSEGHLYTLARRTGLIYRIGLDGKVSSVKGAPSYPRVSKDGRVIETGDFADAYLVARGPRVVFNSPSHADALMLFTDGSHAPLRIAKSSAVDVSAQGGAEALARSTVNQNQETKPAPGAPKAKPNAPQPVNTKINCKAAKQKPHIPVLNPPVPGSRSVQLSWTYTVLSSQDCYPSTYLLTFKALSANAPPAPSSVQIQGQTGANVSGLYPSTQYQVVVTAYINGQSTPSQPMQFTTGPEGPAAPTNLAVTADNAGNWNVTWDSCGTVAQGCVPAQSWTITPSFCDGRGVASPPTPITRTADPTARQQPPAVYAGGDALLGRGLQFQVQGTGDQGQAGAPSAKSPCVYSWAPPKTGGISVVASQPPPTASASGTTTTTASVTFADGAIHDLGGVGGTLTYKLLSNGAVVDTVGPTEATTATLHGIKAATDYQVVVYAAPPRHPTAGVTVGPVAVKQAVAEWPAISVNVGQDDVKNDGSVNADVTMHIGGISAATANDEHFDVSWVVDCGGANAETATMSRTGIDPADPITFSVSRLSYSGDCSVKIQHFAESAGSGVYGGTPAPNNPRSGTFTIDQPTLTGVSSSDFNASWDGSAGGMSQVAIQYAGGNPVLGLLASWTVSISDPSGDSCGGYSGAGSLRDVAVPQSCVDVDGASGDHWKVVISVSSIGGQRQGPFTLNKISGGAAPTYNPPQCDTAAANLTATWDGTAADPAVKVAASDPSKIKDCSSWAYTVVGPNTANCASGTEAPPQDIAIPETCTDTPASTGWSVTVTYKDATGNSAPPLKLDITGSPPS